MEVDKALTWLDMRIDGAQAIIVSGGGSDWIEGAVEWQTEARNARDCIASLAAEVASYERGEKLLAARIETLTENIEIYQAMTKCFEEIRARDAILIGNDFS